MVEISKTADSVKQAKNRKKDTRFQPGKSGNPKGRPKQKTLMEVIREELLAEGAKPGIQDVARSYIGKMADGSFPHLKEYIDRQEGKVPDRIANADGGNLAVKILRGVKMDEI